ncbi:TldD/PmbA family protein [Occallatibacter riparius]|uniref:TldD/PmbA family protein n=1 Tax=Occallatibacter riparius TaxID=1002689 RepID=A0A9J7BTS3_9BACT|nr:TldD/PmbA family protein [Occallatibacter riparius]UWZ84318.1 TldD/PmbA family protein [Occallatibacter riparius]
MTETAVNSPSTSELDLESLAADVVKLAVKAGASDAEAAVREGEEFSVTVRLGEVEKLVESGSRALGLRVFQGKRSATASTSDLTADGIRQLVDSAMALVKITEEDEFAGLPEAGEFGRYPGDLHLYFDDVNSLPGEERIEMARRAEAAALAYDPRIGSARGASFETSNGRKVLANSRGFVGANRASYVGFGVVPLAKDENGAMQRDYWDTSARRLADLDTPEAVGREAARRALRKLGARRMPTQQIPIVFAPETARSFVGLVFDASSGDAIWRHASFLAGKLGEQILSPGLNIIDDSTMILPNGTGGYGTSPFDGEGLPSRHNVVVEDGVLKTYMLNTYAARKLGMKSTHNASRGLAGTPGIAAGNLYLEPGTQTPEEIIKAVPRGLYVTSLIGFGVNMVTGDYSRGAAGLWIENGELTHAVEEVTIAGKLADMLRNITAVGNDLRWRGAVVSPTIRIDGMTLAGA